MGNLTSLRDSIDSIDYRKFPKETSIDSIDYKHSESQSKNVAIADRLLEKLGEPKSWKFYLKCTYKLPEDEIWHFVELATRPGIINKNRYFVKIANNAMS